MWPLWGAAVSSITTSQLQVPRFDPELRLLLVSRFFRVLWFPPASQKHASRWFGGSRIPTSLDVKVCAWCQVLDCCVIQGVYPPDSQCFWERLWIYHNLHQDKTLAENEWMISAYMICRATVCFRLVKIALIFFFSEINLNIAINNVVLQTFSACSSQVNP